MGGLSPWHWMAIVFVALLLFGGRGKLSGLMSDAARGIRSFRDELKDKKPSAEPRPAQISIGGEAGGGAA
jgi:sec-independent protein translocase protein TatA